MIKDSAPAGRQNGTTVAKMVEQAIAAWLDDCDLTEQTVRRLMEVAERFRVFLARDGGVRRMEEIGPDHVRRFIKAPFATDSGPQPPAVATMHLRRACLRLLFRTARQLGVFAGDPTLDIVLPPRTSLKVRALTDEEVALCRSFSLHTLTETRRPAAWALAETTARTSEIPYMRVSDLDLERARVWIARSAKTEPRWGQFTSWGLTQIMRRVQSLEKQGGDPLLVYRGEGSPESKQAASCIAISETILRAGFGSEPDVRPLSVTAWAAAKIFEQTGRVDEVARRLGIRSLDRAARFIDFDWKTPGGEQD